MSKSLCVIDESPALLPPPVLLFAGLVLLSCPVQKYTCFLFFLFIENKKLHIWPLLACVHALSLKSEISLAYCEFNTLFELARAADGNALPAKTPCGTGRKHSTKGKAAKVSRGGDTVRCVDSAKQHLQSQTRKINCGAAVLSCHDILKHSARAKRRLWRLHPVSHGAYCRSTSASPHPRLATSTKVLLLLGCLVPLSHLRCPSRLFRLRPSPHKSPCRLSYLLMMFLQRPSSFLMSATSWRRAAFSRSRKAARTEIWFSFSRRASRERFAASLFFTRRLQYFSSCRRRRCGMLGCVGRKVEGGEKKKKKQKNKRRGESGMRRFSHLMRVSKMGERNKRWKQLNSHRYKITKLWLPFL